MARNQNSQAEASKRPEIKTSNQKRPRGLKSKQPIRSVQMARNQNSQSEASMRPEIKTTTQKHPRGQKLKQPIRRVHEA
jgi:hypothetical protein